jgi:hypothetical protein
MYSLCSTFTETMFDLRQSLYIMKLIMVSEAM